MSRACSFPPSSAMNLLSYVHLRNIYQSTGAGRVARQLTEHVARKEDVVLRILGDRSDHDRVVGRVGEPWTSYDYALFDRDTSRQQALWYLTGRPRAESYWPDVNVVHCAAESYVPTDAAGLIVTVHDAAFFEQDAHGGGLSQWRQQLKWRLLYRRLASQADLFHTVSHFSAERLAHFFPSIRSRLRVVHNAIPPHFFDPPDEAGWHELNKAGLSDARFILLPRGLHFRKNADLVLDAWPAIKAEHPDVQLVVSSHNDATYVAKARALDDSTIITGFVSDDFLNALYRSAQIVWMPSRYEGFGLPVLEAMACETPVVASDATSLPEIAGDAALLAPVDNPDAHVDAIIGLLNDEVQRQHFAEAGLERAQTFTWSRAADQFYSHLQELS